MIKKILKKVGIDLEKDYICVKCQKAMPVEKKRCPHCRHWNDCCSLDPELIKNA